MSSDEDFQYLVDHLFPLYNGIRGITLKLDGWCSIEPKGDLSIDLFNMMSKTMCVLEQSCAEPWMSVLTSLLRKVTLDPEIYCRQLMRFCQVEEGIASNINEKFINLFCVVNAIGVRMHGLTKKRFFMLSRYIVTVYYENNLKRDFKKYGGWKRLEKYLAAQNYTQFYDALQVYLASNSNEDLTPELKKILFSFDMKRKTIFSSGIDMEKYTNDQVTHDLTRQVVATIEASIVTEIFSVTMEKKPSTSSRDGASKPLSELGAVGGQIPGFGEGDSEAESPTFEESVKYVTSSLLFGLDRLQLQVEHSLELLNFVNKKMITFNS
ncbi:uncharacterized protein NPIL_232931 [Nephila pilipes]|uniref:Uncharacterized protein n=1 Tax=Nephila pilipes TaxID=299642 RepID=A0A8X6NJP1_NEPPI|nr:uncharacterized protein NPIL_232931 [Nephila pilipes]